MSGLSRFRFRSVPPPSAGRSPKWGSWYCEVSPGNWKKFDEFSNPDGWTLYREESCADSLHGKPPYHEGGPLRIIKIENQSAKTSLQGYGSYITNFKYNTSVGFGKLKYSGAVAGAPLSITGGIDNMSMAIPWLTGDANTIPSTALLDSGVWDRTKPKIEQGGLFVAIAEIRDVPHMLQETARGFHEIWKAMGGRGVRGIMTPKNVAKHFLNHNFGWVPFIKDVGDLIDNVKNAQDKISRLKRDNGNWVRRRAILVNQTDTTVTRSSGINVHFQGSNDLFAIDGTGHYVDPYYEFHRTTHTFANSVGSFRYYLPEFDEGREDQRGLLGDMKRRLAIHGARINPSNVYKAIPWTWLIDWVSDIGKSIQAVQDQTMDNMAARYLYLIHHQIKTIELRQHLPFNSASGGDKVLSYSQIIDCKQRKEADSPFGFGLTWQNLNAKQLALLAAIGITRR
jgi:hypothetical protein